MDAHYAVCAVTKQNERISAERQGMIKYHNNGNGWFNILLKYLSGITRANGEVRVSSNILNYNAIVRTYVRNPLLEDCYF